MTLPSLPVRKLIAAGVLSAVALANIVLGCLVFSWVSTANPLPAESLGNDDTSTVFYDNQGNEVVRLSVKENRLWVPYTEIPDNLKKAFVAVEDERFWTHSGIDVQRIAGAVFGLVTGRQSGGGSTITQQLVKNLSGRWEPTLKRKVQEQWAALDLERRLSKEKILELYLNVIYLGNGAYGVQAASRGYFGKDVGDLNLAECAFVAGLTKNPAKYGTQVPAALVRQKTVLTRMRDQKMVTPDEFKAALTYPISYTGTEVQKRVSTYSWFVDAAIEDILTDMNTAYGWNDQVAQNKLFNGGLKVWLTMDPRVQKPLDDVFTKKNEAGGLEFFPRQERGGPVPQGAMVVLEPKTGHILGLSGGSGLKNQSRELNRATQTLRQPGSAIKPLGIYAPAVERNLITEASVVDDVPVHLPGAEGATWDPGNFDLTFHGLMTIREAIAESDNIVAVKTLLQVGLDESMDFLRTLGISTLVPGDRQGALALGGLTRGVTVREMTGAYGALANQGRYNQPVTYTKVEDHDGRVLLETKPDPRTVMGDDTAFIMTDMMTEVLKSGTAKGYAVQGGRIATAGKSGTTQDVKDKWFVGYTPYLLGVCWYGYDRPRSFPAEQQPIRIWSAVMEAAHKNLNYGRAQFSEPQGIVHAAACIDSGMRPTDRCDLDPRAVGGASRIRTFAFKTGTEPNEDCDVHGAPVKVDSATGCLAAPDCPPDRVVLRSFLHRPDPWQDPLPGDPLPADAVYEEKNQVVSPLH